MRRFAHAVPLSALVALAAACGPAPDAGQEGVGATADTATQPGPPAPPDATIRLSMTNGQVVVQPESVEVTRGAVVRWEASDPNVVWVVVFSGDTPMLNGRRVFNGGGGPGNPDQAPVNRNAVIGQEYKYWVFYPDGQGGYLQLDPKLVIIDDPGPGVDTVGR